MARRPELVVDGQTAADAAYMNTIVNAIGDLYKLKPSLGDGTQDSIVDVLNRIPTVHFKNFIINGDFSVWQRGTSFSSAGYTVDRWRYDTDTDDSVSISKTNTTGSELFTAQSYASIALAAGTTGTYNKFSTRLESPKLYFGKTVTLSFWAKASVATNITAKIAFNFSGTEYNAVSSAVSIGTTWQRHTVTFVLGTPSGFTESGSDYLDVALLLPVNTTVTIDIANVQLEEGDTATDFEYVPFDVQLLRCMRYYERGGIHQKIPASTGWRQYIQFRVPKRAPATVGWDSTYTLKGYDSTNGWEVPTSLWYHTGSAKQGFAVAMTFSVGKNYIGTSGTSEAGFEAAVWYADAEL